MSKLHDAAAKGDLKKVRELIENGADVNARYDGWTPLDYAASHGHLEIARFLFDKGADVNLRDKDGSTPLRKAAFAGHLNVVRFLVESGADVNARDNAGWTPLHDAAFWNHLDVARLLIESGADVNARSIEGFTPLHLAASNGHLEIVKFLIEKGADVNARDEKGRAPLDLARERGHVEVVRLLESAAKQGWSAQPAKPQRVEQRSTMPRGLLVSVEVPRLAAGEWGVLRVKLGGKARLLLEGEVDWLDPGEAEGIAEVPVKPKKAGRLPVAVVAKWEGVEERRVVWLEATERAERETLRSCPNCGAPVEPGASYCWRCGAKL